MDLLADLEARGLVQESTDRAALAARLAGGHRSTLYYGCDPTADSLHHGNLIGLVMLRRFQDAGHFPIALAGGATGMIGDPSGRSDERNLLDDETLDGNVAAIKPQIGRIIELDGGAAGSSTTASGPSRSPSSVPPRRRQARHGEPDAGPGERPRPLGVRARHLVHRVQLHAVAGQRLPVAARPPRLRAPARRLRPVGEHPLRGRPDQADPPAHGARARLAPAHGGRRIQAGQDDGRPAVARPREDVALPVPPALGAARRRRRSSSS